FIEARHRAKSGADLGFHQENRRGFIVQRRAEASFPVGVALITPLLKHNLPVLFLGRQLHRAGNRLPTAHRVTTSRREDRDEREKVFHWFAREIFQMTPVPVCGFAPPCSSNTPKSTT